MHKVELTPEQERKRRLDEVYTQLADLTTIPLKLRREARELTLCLALVEYLRCNEDNNPIHAHFYVEEEIE